MEEPDRPAASPRLLAYSGSELFTTHREYFRGGSRLSRVLAHLGPGPDVVGRLPLLARAPRQAPKMYSDTATFARGLGLCVRMGNARICLRQAVALSFKRTVSRNHPKLHNPPSGTWPSRCISPMPSLAILNDCQVDDHTIEYRQ